ncbi:uncharacterized protein MONOS_12358 [Monocercomonoides exilis]|uniref:uncharacterized protein n=1 Tax=Monocercomonoides exilis TaxID=2049356 RepID=UPI00355A1ACE|nr:hypothetical protein MONOS_12358 [Monocercomonoides exilis]|eukprot:MONOS_12358.1-p1 / transcript=MONOS_12358.1 / gene=MONOS_12358 / organism=Monocercomonoides_exilis_PA203 / gene_product=unspecified product / transcript_product=unspecified product / location=Mono_scaffold00680:1348-2169(+) / protein_length=274 / sequence_SO=supercontig / SO=protein_coding / is_pseudo=false
MSNMELMFRSIEAVLVLTEMQDGTQEMNEGDSPIVHLKCCTLHSLLQNAPSDPSIISCSGIELYNVSVQNTTIKNCESSQSESGGGMIMKLSEKGVFECCFPTISGCFCSATGRGGAIFQDCSSIARYRTLPFFFKNITFLENKAFRGRDVYVRCSNIKSQIRSELFQLDFRPPYYQVLSIWGCTAKHYADEQDLLLLVIENQSETIFASSLTGNASDTRQCGAMSEPCISLNVALPHFIPSVYSNLLIDKLVWWYGKQVLAMSRSSLWIRNV